MNVLIDSDVLIEVLRGRDQTIIAKWQALIVASSEVLFSPVTAAEIWRGAFPQEHQTILKNLAFLECAQADYETGRIAGDFLRRYAKSHSLEIADALIAAAAIQHRAALWTRNRKHYPMPHLTFY
jgi:predicted nucleic acid-binding protein